MIHLPPEARAAIVAHAFWCEPNEACGLLAGIGGQVRMVYALTNVASSPVAYTVDPTEHFRALQHAERAGWDLIGVFHSHPNGPAEPSEVDRRLALAPAWHYVIVGGAGFGELRSFRIRDGHTEEEVVDCSPLPSGHATDRPGI